MTEIVLKSVCTIVSVYLLNWVSDTDRKWITKPYFANIATLLDWIKYHNKVISSYRLYNRWATYI